MTQMDQTPEPDDVPVRGAGQGRGKPDYQLTSAEDPVRLMEGPDLPAPAALAQAGFGEPLSKFGLDDPTLQQGGRHRRHYTVERDDVRITVEQNQGTQLVGATAVQVTYPPVAIIEGPKGRVACDPSNVDLILQLTEEVAGD